MERYPLSKLTTNRRLCQIAVSVTPSVNALSTDLWLKHAVSVRASRLRNSWLSDRTFKREPLSMGMRSLPILRGLAEEAQACRKISDSRHFCCLPHDRDGMDCRR